tara:strand:+ start:336 stop:737 length:402 start_codon:yes stop_codon:yes gene_type:complete
MNIVKTIKDSIETSLLLKLFKNEKESAYNHIFNSKLIKFTMNKCKNNKLNNFNSNTRLKKKAIEAYPLNDRPRGIDDIKSVKYYSKKIKNKKYIEPIWIIYKKGKYILLDGAHRIVAHYIENKKNINAYIILH